MAIAAKTPAAVQTDAPNIDASHLQHINFDFRDSKTKYLTHGLHPYPAKFIPQIPDTLIRELSNEGDTVADIFCGSGTTLVEALLLNRSAVGFDANPLACLISRSKTTRFAPGDPPLLLDVIAKAEDYANRIANAGKTLFLPSGVFVSEAPRPSGGVLDFWFEPFIVEELAEILSWCRTLPSETARTVALVAFSSIVVTVSKQDSDTRYVRREKNLAPGETMSRFARALKSSVIAVDDFTRSIRESLSCEDHSRQYSRRPCGSSVRSDGLLAALPKRVQLPPLPHDKDVLARNGPAEIQESGDWESPQVQRQGRERRDGAHLPRRDAKNPWMASGAPETRRLCMSLLSVIPPFAASEWTTPTSSRRREN